MFFKRLLLTAVGTLAGIPFGVVVYGYSLSPEWSVQRSLVMDASDGEVQEMIATPAEWVRWEGGGRSSLLTFTVDGPPQGTGAGFSWDGHGQSGHLEITETNPSSGISYRLQVPGQPEADGTLEHSAEQGGVLVTWKESGVLGSRPLGGFFVRKHIQDRGRYLDDSLRMMRFMVEARRPATPQPPADP